MLSDEVLQESCVIWKIGVLTFNYDVSFLITILKLIVKWKVIKIDKTSFSLHKFQVQALVQNSNPKQKYTGS